jgi:hypothetical protein
MVLRLLLVCFRRLILRIVGAEVDRVATASPWLLGCKINGMSLVQLVSGSAGLTYIRDDPRNVTWLQNGVVHAMLMS